MALTESMFGLAADVEDDRLCRDIPDSQCREEPRNLVRVTLAHIGSKAGDALADPKVVMPWLMGALGAPAFLTAMIVPIRESLALLPQVIVGGVIRRFAKRKYFWVYAALIQGLAVIAMAGVAYGGMKGHAAGWAIIALVTLFSLARGVASIAWKDTLGKTVDKGRRGRVGGYAASAAGVIASGVGLYLALSPEAARPDWLLLALLAAAGASWIAGALIFLTVNEHDGATDGGRGIKDIARDQIRLILGDAELQRFILARALMTATALSGPLYVALAQRSGGQALDNLGWLLLASGLAGALSGSFWGMLADRSSRATMAIGALISGLLGFAVLALVTLAPGYATGVLPFAAALFVLNIGHSGVRIGRKTQIVDIAGGDAKAEYVAVSNTVIGVLLVVIGAGVGAVSAFSLEAGLLLLAAMALSGAAVSMRLENAQAS